MSDLKLLPCPYCGHEPLSYAQTGLVACCYGMCGVNPSSGSYIDWNQRAETETEKRLTAIATKHAERADELYDALDNLLELIESCNGLEGVAGTQYTFKPLDMVQVVEAKAILDKSRIEAEEVL